MSLESFGGLKGFPKRPVKKTTIDNGIHKEQRDENTLLPETSEAHSNILDSAHFPPSFILPLVS